MVAFPALVTLQLVLPGVVFYYFYRTGTWTSPVTFSTVTEEIAFGLVFAPPVHLLWIALLCVADFIPHVTAPEIDFSALIRLISGRIENSDAAIGAVANHPYAVSGYFLGVNAISVLSGLGFHALVRGQYLDHIFRFLRFDNEWYYILRCEAPLFARSHIGAAPWETEGSLFERWGKKRAAAEQLASANLQAYITAIIDYQGEAVLYRGILTNFYFDNSGNLDRLVLRETYRRELSDDASIEEQVMPTDMESSSRYYPIKGDLFVLRYSEVRTVNVEYFQLEPTSDEVDEGGQGDRRMRSYVFTPPTST